MEEIIKYALLVIGGALAGLINIIAGAGSLITLPILIGLGMPPTTANGTNRIAVIMQDISATYKFIKNKRLPIKIGLKLMLPTIIGGVIGAVLAAGLTDKILNIIIISILVLMIIYVVWQPQNWNPSTKTNPKDKIDIFTFIIFLAIGFYAGFIQAAATYIWFAALLWRVKVDMVAADAIKIFLNLVLTPFALIIFFYYHQVLIFDGLLLGIGSFIGGWYGAKAAISWSPKFIRILMIIILLLSLLYMLLFKLFKVF
ncbi:MAG: sulfite exporter TauE/SafE family protein [Bacteroidales bacterium]|nr:sulfite exporter TauE/SafE family protein [Bacteroidales bacterium]